MKIFGSINQKKNPKKIELERIIIDEQEILKQVTLEHRISIALYLAAMCLRESIDLFRWIILRYIVLNAIFMWAPLYYETLSNEEIFLLSNFIHGIIICLLLILLPLIAPVSIAIILSMIFIYLFVLGLLQSQSDS